uniref:Complexin 4c n=1 Tax=Sinocyclocheilus rhinocerous TaxID=307959 RepID=A0A673KWK8_9TELE
MSSFTWLYYGCFSLGTVWKQSAQDEATVQMARDDLDFPEELAKMVEEDEEQEEMNDSFLGKLQNMDVDFDSIKAKAQSTMTEVKQAAEEKCVMM